MSSSSDGWNLKPGGNNCKAEVGNVDTFSIENRVSWMMREETEATIISIENSWYWKKVAWRHYMWNFHADVDIT